MRNDLVCKKKESGIATVSEISTCVANSVLNISEEQKQILALTPKEGYLEKLEIIQQNNDMSSKEKIDAISAAEREYKESLAQSLSMVQQEEKNRMGIIFLVLTAVITAFASPEAIKGVSKTLKKITF